jgi:3-isopropylmalate dehydrogenase
MTAGKFSSSTSAARGGKRSAAAAADGVENAVAGVLRQGLRTADIAVAGEPALSTAAMGDAVVAALRAGA